jgi:hypothetical protein
VAGLALEFARGAISGLARCSAALPPGYLTVAAGAYDEVDSSFRSFEYAAWLLRSVFSATLMREPVTTDSLDAALQQCTAAIKY